MSNVFTSTARRGGRLWVIQCDQHPRAISLAARLDQAEEGQQEAIACVARLPLDSIQVTVHVVLDPTFAGEREDADRRQRDEESAAELAAENRRQAALAMKASGLTVQDIETVLQMSHRRARQLIST